MNLKTFLTLGSFLFVLLLVQDSYGDAPAPYISLGCWSGHPIGFMESKTAELRDNFVDRTDAVNKCFRAAHSFGFQLFGLYNGGLCMSSKDDESEYTKGGRSTSCNVDGRGGEESYNLYRIPDKDSASVYDTAEYSPPVTCSSNEMSVSLDMTKFNGVVWSSVSVNGQTETVCKAQVNIEAQTATFTFPLGLCNSSIEAQPTKNILTYSNVIETTVDSGEKGNVTRGSDYEIHIACTYNITRGLEAVFLGNVSKTVYSGIGNGTFKIRQDLYQDSAFQLSILPTDSIHVSKRVFASVALISDAANLKMRVVSCTAYPSGGTGHQHSLIENRCLNDPTTEFVSETSSEYRYSFQSFKFMHDASDVLIRCAVVVCPKTDHCGANPTNQCGRRKKRNVVSDNRELQLVIGGPLHLVGQRLHSPLQKLFRAQGKVSNV